jgi:site-specific recombinase XerD
MTEKQNPAVVYLSKWSEKSDTRKTMRAALARIVAVLDDEQTIETYMWHDLRYENVRAIAAELADEDMASSTINQSLSALRGVLDTAWRMGMLPDEEYRRIQIENVRGRALPAGRALSREEMDVIEKALVKVTPMEAALVAVLAGAGLRRVEAVKLTKESYDPETGRLTALGKGNKERSVPVGKRWCSAIETWQATLKPREKMFAMTRRQLSYVIECFCTTAGVKTFTPHDLRRTFGTHICTVADIAIAQRLLGHKDMQTTGIYDRRGKDVEDEAVKDL